MSKKDIQNDLPIPYRPTLQRKIAEAVADCIVEHCNKYAPTEDQRITMLRELCSDRHFFWRYIPSQAILKAEEKLGIHPWAIIPLRDPGIIDPSSLTKTDDDK